MSYWNGEGLYQNELNKISENIPDIGMTNNKYMNLYITANNVYYDVYNDGGCNLDNYEEDIKKYVAPFNKALEGIDFEESFEDVWRNLENEEKLEIFMDSVVKLVEKNDFSYEKITIFADYTNNLISYKEKENFSKSVFGDEKYLKDWIDFRINKMGYKLV